jgi:diguanylate cyclase (GGDEF)-like protein
MDSQVQRDQNMLPRFLKNLKFDRIPWIFTNLAKRVFDFIMALFGLILLSPLFVLISILIKRDSPGPVFYRGPRLGKNGHVFQILKFRTMYENPESYQGPRLTREGDPRITTIGKWLRDTKINELPQLWNVLKGEMSLVGPRPEDPELAKDWPEESRTKILSIRPGITSPASILYHDEEKLLSKSRTVDEYFISILPNKIRLDQLYVYHNSFFGDLDTIFWTLAIFIPRWAGTRIPEGYIFAGPIFRIINRYLSWFMKDFVESLVVFAIGAILWRTQMPLNWGVMNIVILAFVMAFLYSGINSITGLNRIVWSHATADNLISLVISGGFVTLLIMGFNYVLRQNYYWLSWLGLPSLPSTMILVMGILAQAVFIFTRYRLGLLTLLSNRWLSMRQNTLALGERVLIVGDGENSQIVTWLLSRKTFRTAFSVVGLVDDNNPTHRGMQISGTWMLGGLRDIPKIVKRHDIGVIISTLSSGEKENNEFVFDFCQTSNVRLIFINDLMMMVDRQVTQPLGSFDYPVWLDERLEFKAMHNAITGLPNRYLFQDRLKRSLAYAKRYNIHLAIVFIRLEGLNIIYDKIGRKYGDQVLIEAAKRLTNCGRDSDTLAHIAENEFVFILENLADKSAADVVAKRVLAMFSEPFRVERREYSINAHLRTFVETEGYAKLDALCKVELEMIYNNQNRLADELVK